jgi:hypothetical protein
MRIQKFTISDNLGLINGSDYWLEINEGHIITKTGSKLRFMLNWNISDAQLHCQKFGWKLERT